MADPNLMSGEQTEAWFRQFAEETGILHQPQYSLKEVVKLLDTQLPIRLKNARRNLYAEYPEGNEWIDTILKWKSDPQINSEVKSAFTLYLLDLALATDGLISLKDSQGEDILVAVDATNNPYKQEEKLNRIRGLPEEKDHDGHNRNLNIGSARTTLGINKHIVVILNQDGRLLPSYDKLLNELQAFANTPARTGVLNLQNVPEQDRFINQQLPESPKQTLGRYNQELNLKDPAQRINGIATRTYQEGLERETAIKVLLEDPFFQGMKSRPAQAQKLAAQAIERIWSQQEQAQSIPAPEAKPKLADWPIYASAIDQGHVIQERVKKVVAAHQQSGKSLDINDSIAIKKAFKAYQEELTTIQNWYGVAQQLDATPSYLREISKTEQALRQGNPLTKDTREQMNRDTNQLAYNRLSAAISEEEPRKFLVRLAANAAKKGLGASQIRAILSLSPKVQSVQAKSGKQASLNYVSDVMVDGLKLRKREQPPPPRQDRGPDIDRGPSRGR